MNLEGFKTSHIKCPSIDLKVSMGDYTLYKVFVFLEKNSTKINSHGFVKDVGPGRSVVDSCPLQYKYLLLLP